MMHAYPRLSLAVLGLTLAACSGSTAAPDAGSGSGTGTGSSSSGSSTSSSSSSSTTASSSVGGSSGSQGGSSSGQGTTVCLAGCPSSSSSSSGSSSGSSGSSGSGGCASLAQGCELVNCCKGLSCDLASDTCVSSAPDAGPGCPLSGDGGSCVSLADCAPPLACNLAGGPGADAGICGPPGPAPSLQCLANGHNCGPSLPGCCGGSCQNGVCQPRTACAFQGASCGSGADCCSGLTCLAGDAGVADAGASDGGGGSCASSCGAEFSACTSNADCCTGKGFTCNQDFGFCYTELTDQPFNDAGLEVPCGGSCSAFECRPGAYCQLTVDPTTGNPVDPCAVAGLVCDATYSVCRAPTEFDVCTPGGPPCQPIANSTAEDLQCIQVSEFVGTPFLCVQPCSVTEDCVDALTTCQPDGNLGNACIYSVCSDYFGPCSSAGQNDGLCIPFPNGGVSTIGLCEQAAPSGGGTGSSCTGGLNRQEGGFCGPQDFCVEGLCSSVCNAGTAAVPGCAGATPDGGPACLSFELSLQGQPDDLGICSPHCDFTSDAGGGCVPPAGGAPEKCFPQYLFGLPDVPTGVCGLGPAVGTPVGEPCADVGDLDPCVAGSLCLGTGAGGICAQLCTPPGGTAGCPGQLICYGLSSFAGYCAEFLPDGGEEF